MIDKNKKSSLYFSVAQNILSGLFGGLAVNFFLADKVELLPTIIMCLVGTMLLITVYMYKGE